MAKLKRTNMKWRGCHAIGSLIILWEYKMIMIEPWETGNFLEKKTHQTHYDPGNSRS